MRKGKFRQGEPNGERNSQRDTEMQRYIHGDTITVTKNSNSNYDNNCNNNRDDDDNDNNERWG